MLDMPGDLRAPNLRELDLREPSLRELICVKAGKRLRLAVS